MDFINAYDMPYFAIFIVSCVLCLAYFHYKRRNIPPGPTGLPLLGYTPYFGAHPQNTFLELGKKYGNIFSISMGPQLAIVLNDYEAIRAAYVGQADVFAGRTDGFVFRFIATGDDEKTHGIAIIEGEIWKTTRRFMLQTFRDLGMGKSAIQDRILEEAQYMTDIFAQHKGQAFNPSETLSSSVANVVCILCFGERFDHTDPEFLIVVQDIQNLALRLGQAGPLQAYPVLRFLPGKMRTIWNEFLGSFWRFKGFIETKIAEHRTTYQESEATRDYIDAFLHEQNKEAATSGIRPAFQDQELLMNLRAFFGAGTETTSTTMNWLLLYMLHYPDVQRKIHAELDEKIGRHRSVTVEDRAKVPYLEAVIREVQRLANVTPFGVLRANTEETRLLGYRIPKRSYIMPNFKSVNTDPKLWADPLDFKPERFLTGDGKIFEPPYFMPFSIGKRTCVGESLARMEMFLFFANILQRFDIGPAANGTFPSTDKYITGIACRPLPFEIQAIPRR